MKKINLIILSFICLFFLITRFYRIDSIPASVYWDEASIGYNAFSIVNTSHDEWGKRFPIHFRAFGEFKLPVYIYSVAIVEKFLGLNTLAVRLPAVFYSLVVIILTYFLVLEVTAEEKIALISSFLLTVSNWFFIFSRVGYEADAGLAFYLLGILLSLKAKQKIFLIYPALISFILSLYSYNSFRILTPLTILILLFFILKEVSLKKIYPHLILSFFILLISVIPIIRLLVFDAGFARVSAFSVLPAVEQVYDLQGKPHLQLIYNRNDKTSVFQNLSLLAQNYLSHFSFDFLFLKGDSNSRNHMLGSGELYLIDLPLILFGILYIFKAKKKINYIILILLVVSPLPAALYKESPHALRALPLAVFLSIFSACGIFFICQKVKFKYGIVIVLMIYFILFGNYFINFLNSYNFNSSSDWQYSYSQVFTKYSSMFSSFDHVIVSDHYAQPYIFALFYLKYPTDQFINEKKLGNVSNWGFSTVSSFGKFTLGFKPAELPVGNLLVFASPDEKLNNLNPISIIYDLGNNPQLYVYQIKKQ